MQCARAIRWAFYLALVGGMVVEGQATEGEVCDWYCWVEERIAWLTQEVLNIEGMMVRNFLSDQGEELMELEIADKV
jgi:hypothetical protein